MTQESAISEEMRDAIGVESEPVTHEVEKGAIIKFAQAIGDDNPLFIDEEAARQTRYGGLIAPPTFLRSMPSGRSTVSVSSPYPAALDGGSDWEYVDPVRPVRRDIRRNRPFEMESKGGVGDHVGVPVSGARRARDVKPAVDVVEPDLNFPR